VRVIPTNGGDDIFVVSRTGMTIRFAEDEVRAMGRAAAGVRGMKMKPDDEVVSCDVARDDAAILIVTDGGYGKRTQLDKFNAQNRGGQGVRGIKLTAKKGFVVAAFMVALDDEIFAIASDGVVTRMEVRGMEAVRELEAAVRELGVKAATAFPAGPPPQVPINGQEFYPEHAQCGEAHNPHLRVPRVSGAPVPVSRVACRGGRGGTCCWFGVGQVSRGSHSRNGGLPSGAPPSRSGRAAAGLTARRPRRGRPRR